MSKTVTAQRFPYVIILCIIISLLTQGCENKYPEGTNIKIEVDDGLDHLFFLPNGYQEHREKEWPLILFLHGMGERGDNLELVKIHGIPKISQETDTFPFIAFTFDCAVDASPFYYSGSVLLFICWLAFSFFVTGFMS